jgi:hypothetical protein
MMLSIAIWRGVSAEDILDSWWALDPFECT